MPNYAFSPDAEFPIIYGEKGILSFNIEDSNQKLYLKSCNIDNYDINL